MALSTQAEIIQKLRLDLLQMEGLRVLDPSPVDKILGPLRDAFPCSTFPCGAVHEFILSEREDGAASGGFISLLLSVLMQRGGVAFWISSTRTVFPSSLKSSGI